MKTLFTLLALLSTTFSCFAQNTESYDDLMKQSRKARTTSIIMVAGGSAVAVGGVGTLIYGLIKNELGEDEPLFDQNGNFIGYRDKKYTTEIVVGAIGTVVGLGVALSSIAFTNKANDLKREAKKAKLKASTDRINIPGLQNGFANNRTRQFKLSLVIPLGR